MGPSAAGRPSVGRPGAGWALLAAALLAACSGDERPEPPAGAPSILVVAIDTLRADRLGCYGGERGLTPRLDALAAESVLFEHAFAPSPWTLPSFATLLTARPPGGHGAGGRLGAFRSLDPAVATIGEAFRDAGWRTASFVNVDFLGAGFGLTRGFEHVDEEYYPSNREVRVAADVTQAAAEWIEAHADEPFFALVHYFDPHAVYAPPQPFRGRFAAPPDRDSDAFEFGTRKHMALLRSGQLDLDPATLGRAEALYDGEVAYTDALVGELLDTLERLGIDERTLVVVTADHGEEFLDHGGFEHGHTLYDELLHVPLLVRWPGRLPPRRVDPPVGLVDVAPTVCDLAGIPPPATFVGRSLHALARGAAAAGGPALLAHGNFWGEPLRSVRTDDWKLVLTPLPGGGERAELYAWREDPRETRDLAAERPELVAELRAALERLEAERAAGGAGAAVELDAEELRRLGGLGYLPGAPVEGGASEDSSPPEDGR